MQGGHLGYTAWMDFSIMFVMFFFTSVFQLIIFKLDSLYVGGVRESTMSFLQVPMAVVDDIGG